MLRNIHIHTHDTVLEIQLCHSFSRVFDHAYYMCVFLCVSPCVCSCVHVCVLWAGRQCSILISREEPISCLACSLNVTGDFSVPGQKPHPHLSESRWDMWWSPSRDFCHYFIHLASTSADTNLVSCPHLGSFSSVSLCLFMFASSVLQSGHNDCQLERRCSMCCITYIWTTAVQEITASVFLGGCFNFLMFYSLGSSSLMLSPTVTAVNMPVNEHQRHSYSSILSP